MCDSPVKLRKGDVVPCGRCSDCIGIHRQGWIKRLYYEAYYSDFAYFTTLTYDEEHLVYGDSESPILNYRDIQLFFKRARKKGFRFKYFGVGEYGEHYGRPHYHVLFFSNEQNFDIDGLLSLWFNGFSDIQIISEANIKYTTKDMLKERELFEGVPRSLKPHIFCSKGIGLQYVIEKKEWYRKNPYEIPKLPFDGGGKSLPRYYKEKIYDKHERNVHRRRLEIIRRHSLSCRQKLDGKIIKKMAHEAKIFSQIVETKKAKRLKINHFNKKL